MNTSTDQRQNVATSIKRTAMDLKGKKKKRCLKSQVHEFNYRSGKRSMAADDKKIPK